MVSAKRAAHAGQFALELEGTIVGFLHTFEGGSAFADVIAASAGAGGIIRKHPGLPRYEPITLSFGFSMGAPLYDWIKAFTSMQQSQKSGAIILADMNFKQLSRVEYQKALITELTFPANDGASKDPAYLTMKIQPEQTVKKQGGGKVSATLNTKAKKWLTSNFRLNIDGLDCSKIKTVDRFTIKQMIEEEVFGTQREYVNVASPLQIPDLTITFGAVSAASWVDWFEDFVIKGNNAEDKEKSGSITYLAPDLKTELMTVRLVNLGIFSLKPVSPEMSNSAAVDLVAALYCEQMSLDVAQTKSKT